MYDEERADLRALEQLEVVLREVGEELATWRARALKAEADTRTGAARLSGPGRGEGESPSESRQLRARLDAAKSRIQGLLARLTFLEEQSREGLGSGGTPVR